MRSNACFPPESGHSHGKLRRSVHSHKRKSRSIDEQFLEKLCGSNHGRWRAMASTRLSAPCQRRRRTRTSAARRRSARAVCSRSRTNRWTALDSAGQSHDLVHLIVFKDFWTGQTARTVFPYYCTTQINTFSPLFSPSLQRYDLTRLSAENRCQASRDAIGRGPPRIARQMGVSLRGADIGMAQQRADHVPPGSIAAHTPARPLA